MSIPKSGSSSPENQSHSASACGSRGVLTHFDQDDGALNDGRPLAPVALAFAPRLGVQTRPGSHPHRAVVFVLVAALGRSRSPGLGVEQGELAACRGGMGAPPASAPILPGRRRRCGSSVVASGSGRGGLPGRAAA
jgi:hypothetical protein